MILNANVTNGLYTFLQTILADALAEAEPNTPPSQYLSETIQRIDGELSGASNGDILGPMMMTKGLLEEVLVLVESGKSPKTAVQEVSAKIHEQLGLSGEAKPAQ